MSGNALNSSLVTRHFLFPSQPAVRLGAAEPKLARDALEGGAAVQALGFERGDAPGESRRGVSGAGFRADHLAVYHQHHLAARRALAAEPLGQLREETARDL